MSSSVFFKIFPPPKFLVMKHAGLDISDEAVRCLEYQGSGRNMVMSRHARIDLPAGLVDGGDIKDEKKLGEIIRDFGKKYDLSYVKVSLPEEKVYLFQSEVPVADIRAIQQNIEFKLEENVPLSAPDAVFYFDIAPVPSGPGGLKVSVSVAPRVYVERMIELLRGAGMVPVAFETIPRSIARAVIPPHSEDTVLIAYIMKNKTGMYIVSKGIVCFTSTLGKGIDASEGREAYAEALKKEMNRIYAYWASHNGVYPVVSRILLVGREAPSLEGALQNAVIGAFVPVGTADVWQNSFDLNHYVPAVSRDESLDYAVAAGLAMNA